MPLFWSKEAIEFPESEQLFYSAFKNNIKRSYSDNNINQFHIPVYFMLEADQRQRVHWLLEKLQDSTTYILL